MKKQNVVNSFMNLAALIPIVGVLAILLNIDIKSSEKLVATLTLSTLIALMVLLHPEERDSVLRKNLYLASETFLITLPMALGLNWSILTIIFFVFSAQAMVFFDIKKGLIWIVIFAAITTVFSFLSLGFKPGVMIILPYMGGYLFFGVFGYATKQSENAKKEIEKLYEELKEAHEKLQEYALESEKLVVSEERNRLAREMHDTLGHRLTVSVVQLEVAEKTIERDRKKAKAIIQTVRDEVKEALNDLRKVVSTLSIPLEVDLSLCESIKTLAKNFEEATKIKVTLSLEECSSQFPISDRTAIYRIIQETLTNIQRHSNAKEVKIKIFKEDNFAMLEVSDDGKGFPEKAGAKGLGLQSMKERVLKLGGSITFGNCLDGGAQIIVQLPLPEGNDE